MYKTEHLQKHSCKLTQTFLSYRLENAIALVLFAFSLQD